MAVKPLTVDEIRNRVIEVRKIRFGEISHHPKNPKRHPDNQRDAFRGAVREIGFASVPVAYHSERANGALVWADGHLRGSEAASYEGEVAILDITDSEADLLLVTADPIAYLAQTDAAALEALLKDVQTSDIALNKMLADMAEEAGITQKAAGTDTEPQIDKAEELRVKWGVEPGMMFALGEHRLICGDCTDKATVERVMGGERADMVFTDPPYNVSYQSNESIESLKARNRRTDGLIVQNDAMTDDEFDRFLDSFLIQLPLKAGGAYYLCAPPGRTETQFRNALDRVSGLALRECIVWVKDRFVFGRQDYHWRHESILYGWKEGESHYFADDRTQDTVWEFSRPRTSELHPTMKPIELPSKAIANSSRLGEIVYDPFAGSGTCIVACENLGRKCRAAEISAPYTAVCLERWHQHTARQPERME